MNPTFQNLASSYLVPVLLSRVKLRWIVYGAVAYYGIKMLNERGMLPSVAGDAFNTLNDGITKGIDMAKQQVGFGQDEKGSQSAMPGSSTSSSSHKSQASTTSGSAPSSTGGIH